MTSPYIEKREVDVSEYTAIKKRMQATADRICDRDRDHHTGGTKMVLRIETSQGHLRADNLKAVME